MWKGLLQYSASLVNSLGNWNYPKCKYQQHHFCTSSISTSVNTVSVKQTSNIIIQVVETQDGHHPVNICNEVHEKVQAFVSSAKWGFGECNVLICCSSITYFLLCDNVWLLCTSVSYVCTCTSAGSCVWYLGFVLCSHAHKLLGSKAR